MNGSAQWSWPAYKVLANNDTGSAPGHQGGIVVPEALRHLFPELSGSLSADVPTVDKKLRAELYECDEHLATVDTRYQYQSWGGARSPESRLTGQLGPLRKRAKGGDLLLIQYNQLDSNLLRLTLIPKTSGEYTAVAKLVGNKRWGAVPTMPFVGGVAERGELRTETYDEDKSPAEIDTTSLTTWAVIAFVARCARRFLECYESDTSEPSAQRAVVAQAVSLAEKIAASGGTPNEVAYIELDGQHFDHHDFVAMEQALSASQQAAENTYAELHEDKAIERRLARILTAICLSELAFSAAIADDSTYGSLHLANLAQEALAWATWADPMVEPAVLRDFRLLSDYASLANLTELSPVSPEVFGELWPDGRPDDWPAMKLSFRPRARIIRTIGDRLVSGPEAAVIELVKNSYDADSSFARITFVPGEHSGIAEIIFEDDGHGMTLQDIEQKWMEPATSDKRDRRFSSKGRRLLGSKGIGRFAASRLGQYLEMVSTAKRITNQNNVMGSENEWLTTTRIPLLDWNAFEQTKYLDDVSFDVEVLAAAKTTGTTLRISLLRDEWSDKRIERLHEELRKLVSPIPHVGTASFKIFLDLSLCTLQNCSFDGPSLLATDGTGSAEIPRAAGEPFEVRPFPLLDACDYSVDGVFDETGHFEGTLIIQRGGLEPEAVQLSVPLHLDQGEEECGVVLVRLHVFDRETDAIRSTAAKAGFGAIGVREARKLLDNIAGVAIYREGFRIRPYGDGENDWLTLDAKRVQNPTIKIGRNQIAGVVSLDDERESNLIERSSREGLEENGSFRRLRSLISTLLAEVVEPKRRQFRISAGLDSRPETSFRDIYDKVQMGWSKILLAKIPESERADAEELVSKESEKLTQYLKRLEERQAQLEARVTLGLIIGEVMHQGNTPLSFIETETARLNKWWPGILVETEAARAKRIEVPRIINGLVASGGKLRVLFDALNPLAGARRGSPKPYDPNVVIEQTLYLFKSKVEDVGIEMVIDVIFESSAIFGYKDDLATALTNLFDNAIYWLAYHKVACPKISVTIVRSDDRCLITIVDNGVGIPAEFSDQLFDIGFTLKPNGTGLGLSIAKEAIYRSNGDLYLQDSDFGTRFQISLPAVDK
ncbi:MAG: ATP-binding protein [Pseudomonadota bacterium]